MAIWQSLMFLIQKSDRLAYPSDFRHTPSKFANTLCIDGWQISENRKEGYLNFFFLRGFRYFRSMSVFVLPKKERSELVGCPSFNLK